MVFFVFFNTFFYNLKQFW